MESLNFLILRNLLNHCIFLPTETIKHILKKMLLHKEKQCPTLHMFSIQRYNPDV